MFKWLWEEIRTIKLSVFITIIIGLILLAISLIKPSMHQIITISAVFLTVGFTCLLSNNNSKAPIEKSYLMNKDYRCSFIKELSKYILESNSEKYRDKLLYDIDKFKVDSPLSFGNSIQMIIDDLILIAWIGSFENDRKVVNENIQKIKEKINIKINEGKKINKNLIDDSDSTTIDYHHKLIDAILNYIPFNSVSFTDRIKELDEVNESILLNNISKFLFHNYLGLSYLNVAKSLFCKYIGYDINTSWRKLFECYANNIIQSKMDFENVEDKRQLVVVLKNATDNLSVALKIADGDSVLYSFAAFNLARAVWFLKVIDKKNNSVEDEWLLVNSAIDAREKNKYNIRVISDANWKGIIDEKLDKELDYANAFKHAIEIYNLTNR